MVAAKKREEAAASVSVRLVRLATLTPTGLVSANIKLASNSVANRHTVCSLSKTIDLLQSHDEENVQRRASALDQQPSAFSLIASNHQHNDVFNARNSLQQDETATV